jgi:hypothetical protein
MRGLRVLAPKLHHLPLDSPAVGRSAKVTTHSRKITLTIAMAIGEKMSCDYDDPIDFITHRGIRGGNFQLCGEEVHCLASSERLL